LIPIRYNIAPTQNVLAIRRNPEIGERTLDALLAVRGEATPLKSSRATGIEAVLSRELDENATKGDTQGCTFILGTLRDIDSEIMNDWKALGGRITIFPMTPGKAPLPAAAELYHYVYQVGPDAFQKAQNALMPSIATGRQGETMAAVAVMPVRIDLSFSPVLNPIAGVKSSLGLIEDTRQLHQYLTSLINSVESGLDLPPVARVALGLQFALERDDSREVNAALVKVLPERYRLYLSDEEDFILQVNRAGESKSDNKIRLNLLTKWSAETIQVVTTAVPQGIAPLPSANEFSGNLTSTKKFLAASVAFDCNNVPSEILDSHKQAQLLRESLNEVSAMVHEYGLRIDGF
jgi:hypothetical protein